MKTNFEKIKDNIYCFINPTAHILLREAQFAILLETVKEKRLLPSVNSAQRTDQFKKDLTQWVDTLDIRAIPQIIDMFKGRKVLPTWLERGKFYIDYNKEGYLDVMQIKKVCECQSNFVSLPYYTP